MTSVTTCKNGLSSLFSHTASATAPPGFVTRNISRRAADGSGKNITPSRLIRTSNELSPNGRASAIQWRKLTFVMPRRCASRSAASTISATASVHITEPVGPTFSAIVKEGSPGPPATSSTDRPFTMPASSISASVTGSNILRRVALYFSQNGADSVHSCKTLSASIRSTTSALLTLFGFNLRTNVLCLLSLLNLGQRLLDGAVRFVFQFRVSGQPFV